MNVSIIAKKKTYEFQAEEVKFYKSKKSCDVGKRYVNCYVSFFVYNVSKVIYNKKLKLFSTRVEIHINADYCDDAQDILNTTKRLCF